MDGIETQGIALNFGPRSKFVIICDNSPDKTISENQPYQRHLRSITIREIPAKEISRMTFLGNSEADQQIRL